MAGGSERTEGDGAPGGRSASDTIKLVVSAIVLVLVVLLGVANTDEVRLDLLASDVRLPLLVVILGSAVAGALIAALLRRRRS